MADLKTPFRYDYVGSFLRPEALKQARKNFEEGKITKEELTAVEDDCIRDLVGKIKKLGYHVDSVAATRICLRSASLTF